MNQHFINGRYVPGQTGETLAKLNPATGEEFARIACGNAADIDAAVKAARAAFEGAWGRLTAAERGRLISKLAFKVQDHFEELAKLEARDTGKPMSQARADMDATIRYFEFYGGAADKVHGHVIPFLNGYHVSVVHEPHGVTGHILPWNYPAQMIGRSLTASLAMGNAVVLKPAEDACATAFRLAELASEVGFPDGAINIVAGRGHEAGAALSAHHGIDFMSFTGSPEVGKMVQHACAEHLIPCTLELGGKSPQIVFEDADIDALVPIACKAIVQNTGQTCSAGSRLLVQKSIYDDVVAEVAKAFSKLTAGTPEMDLDCGPVINAKQRGRGQSFIDQSREAGIPVIAQGQVAQGVPNGGFYVQPTLFGPVPRGNRLEQDEVFGPVLAAFSFEDEEDAIKAANGTDYGLVAAVWTKDGGRQQRVSKRVRAGQVFINGYGAGGGIELPFGGTGKSGHGREKGFIALEEFAVTKTIVHKHG